MKRILVVESHPLMRKAIVRLVLTAWPNAGVAEAGSLAEIDIACRTSGTIGLVVMDPALPDASGLGALVSVQQRLPETPVVVFSARQDDQIVASSNALGAAGYVHKSAGLEEVLGVLRSASVGVRSFPPLNGVASLSQEATAMRRRVALLTPTQMKVMLNIADGRLNKQVAADMQVTEAAIKGHLTAIFRKLGVHNRTQALLALRPLLGDEPERVAA